MRLAPLLLFLSALLSIYPFATAEAQFGLINLQVSSEELVPGNLLEVNYQTSPGTLNGPVDIYFALVQPNGQLLFLQENGELSTTQAPFRRNTTIIEETKPLFSLFPVDIPFGNYTGFAVLLRAGGSLLNPDSYASSVVTATFSFVPLSQQQRALIAQRGNPEFLATTWVEGLHEKRDAWLYVSSNPTLYSFVNGVLLSQTAPSGLAPGAALAVDPSLLTPQTTLNQLTAVFGAPSSVETEEAAPEYQRVRFALGLEVVLLQGYLSAARTFTP